MNLAHPARGSILANSRMERGTVEGLLFPPTDTNSKVSGSMMLLAMGTGLSHTQMARCTMGQRFADLAFPCLMGLEPNKRMIARSTAVGSAWVRDTAMECAFSAPASSGMVGGKTGFTRSTVDPGPNARVFTSLKLCNDESIKSGMWRVV